MQREFTMMVSRVGCQISLIAAAIFSSGCSLVPDQDAAAKKLVGYQLKDPKSSEFEGMTRKDGVTCGYVNSKNGFGAYSGRQAFVVYDGDVIFDDDSAKFHALVGRRCDGEFTSLWSDNHLRNFKKEVDETLEAAREGR